jgi:hypothetical protein
MVPDQAAETSIFASKGHRRGDSPESYRTARGRGGNFQAKKGEGEGGRAIGNSNI